MSATFFIQRLQTFFYFLHVFLTFFNVFFLNFRLNAYYIYGPLCSRGGSTILGRGLRRLIASSGGILRRWAQRTTVTLRQCWRGLQVRSLLSAVVTLATWRHCTWCPTWCTSSGSLTALTSSWRSSTTSASSALIASRSQTPSCCTVTICRQDSGGNDYGKR